MRTSSAEREGIRLLYHLFGFSTGHLAEIFRMRPASMSRITQNRQYRICKQPYLEEGRERDRREVLAYIAHNGPCSMFDVELCCMLDKKAARRHLVALERQHEIERCYFSGEKWRVIA
ncbi:hypothetical protein M0R72_15830 [Candidatus Pacearchaeota archaeon]|nr:hypothetical protein [Candidatus Pacearchaeota archaeon]